MTTSRVLTRAIRVALPLLCLWMGAAALAGPAEDALDKGLGLFDAGKYLEAQQVLLEIDPSALSDEDRGRRDEYLERLQVALAMVDKANKDLEDGEKALAGGDLDTAEEYLQGVLDNEYAAPSLRASAEGLLQELVERRKAPEPVAVPEPAAPTAEPVADLLPPAPEPPPLAPMGTGGDSDRDRAASLIREGYDALGNGRTHEAARLFEQALELVPGHPDAVDGLTSARQHESVETASSNLLDRMSVRDQIRWQRTEAAFREIEREVRRQIIAGQFDLARESLLLATQTVEAGRQYASPIAKYEALKAELAGLEGFVVEEARRYEETRVREQRDEIERERRDRNQRMREARDREVDALLEQAWTHRKNDNLPEAISVMQQVVALEPTSSHRFTLDDWQDLYELRRQRFLYEDKTRNTQKILTDAEISKVPISRLLEYPDDWPEKLASIYRVPTGAEQRSVEDQALQEKLDEKIPVNFEDQTFEDVMDQLAQSQGVNITVIWNDLEQVGIRRDDPITLRLPSEVTFRKALNLILDQVGGSDAEVAYVVGEGVIRVATKTLLDRDVFTEVYDVNDLLMVVPDYTEPNFGFGGGLGGGGFGGGGFGGGGFGGGGFGGGGFGGGGFGGGGGPFNVNPSHHGQIGGGFGGGGSGGFGGGGGGFGGDDQQDREQRIEDLKQLIQDTIEPDSWREGGSGNQAAIAELNGQLVVTQTSSAHAQIADLLEKLRRQRAIQVAIEARFLTITSNYMEEIGLDLDIILNQGNAGFDPVNVGDNRALGPYGEPLYVPRSTSRLGFLPGVPGVGQEFESDEGVRHPFHTPGLIPQRGRVGPSSSHMSPIPIFSNILDITAPRETSVDGSFGSTVKPAMQVFGTFLDNIQVDFLLRATQADRRNSIMNAPRLVLFNGQMANVAVVTTTFYVYALWPEVREGAVAVVPQPQQLFTGTLLLVRATVSADKRYVTMNLTPSVTELTSLLRLTSSGGAAGGAANDAFIQLPVTQNQGIATTVTVPDGGTLLIGGMKKTAEVEIEAGVPVLNKLPVLKRLYSNRSLVKDEQVLLILVKPTIIIQREAEEEAFPTFSHSDI